MPLDVAVNVTYADTGYYRWTIKATLSNNTVLQCYADYYVLNVTGTSSRYASSGTNGPIVPTWGTIAPVAGVHNGGTIHIVYSNKNRTNTLRKPLKVVENMDAYTLTPQVQIRPYGIADFLEAIEQSRIPSFDLNQQLDDIAGYDLVFINFNDGMDGIVNNAAVVQEAINRVNANKVPDDRSGNITQQNVVLGLGTGGLNARYALANMAKNFGGSNTRLLLTHDAPHRGQNIALGLQYLVKFINKSTAYTYNWGQIFPEHAQTVAYFNAKVSKDVLIYKAATEPGDVVENSFIESVYQPMVTFTGNSQPYQFVATSLGNECANPLFAAGREFMNFGESQSLGTKIKVSLGLLIGRSSRLEIPLFSIPLSEIKFETQVSAKSIPNQNTSGRTITVYKYINKVTLFGSVYLLKNGVDLSATAANTLLPIDGVPGSFNTLLGFTELRNYSRGIGNFYFSQDEYITTLFKVKLPYGLALKFSIYGFFKANEYNSGLFSTQYTSVPVGSALDVSPFNTNSFTEKYVNGINQNNPSKSNNFIAQETVQSQSLFNNASMRFTARNARFIFKEMEQLPNLENCSNECFNPYFISGNNPICTSETYSIQGLPRGASITWSASPRRAVSISANNNQVTATKINDGLFNLTATITGVCGPTNPLVLSRELTAGPLFPYISGPFDPIQNTIMNVAYVGEQYYFIASEYIPESPAPTYTWTLTPPTGSGGNVSLFSGGTIYLYFNDGEGNYTLNLTKTTSCGSNTFTMIIPVQQNYGFRISASPNPTSDVLNVTIDNETADVKALKKEENIKIDLIDFVTGTKRKSWSYKNVQITFNLSVANLPKGQYVIRVSKGSYKQTKLIIIN